jgi:hypothetical protein
MSSRWTIKVWDTIYNKKALRLQEANHHLGQQQINQSQVVQVNQVLKLIIHLKVVIQPQSNQQR